MEQVGKRCVDEIIWCKKLKEDHVFREFENIVHVVGRRLREIGVRGWRT